MSNKTPRDPYLESLIKEYDKLCHTSRTVEDEDHRFNLNREILSHSEEAIKAARANLRKMALDNTR